MAGFLPNLLNIDGEKYHPTSLKSIEISFDGVPFVVCVYAILYLLHYQVEVHSQTRDEANNCRSFASLIMFMYCIFLYTVMQIMQYGVLQ